MREGMGLYKAKRKDNGKWIQGYLFCIWEKAYILWGTTNGIPDMVEVDPDTVCERTGLFDKNGLGIFEGDLLKGQQGIMRVFYGKITGHGYGFQWENIGDGFEESMTGFIDEYEVIGSIHDKAVEE